MHRKRRNSELNSHPWKIARGVASLAAVLAAAWIATMAATNVANLQFLLFVASGYLVLRKAVS
jgi:hypothetical protein